MTVGEGGARARVTSRPGRHGPPVVEKFLPPVMGSMLELESGAHRPAPRPFATEDVREGTRAFIEKREPDFKGK